MMRSRYQTAPASCTSTVLCNAPPFSAHFIRFIRSLGRPTWRQRGRAGERGNAVKCLLNVWLPFSSLVKGPLCESVGGGGSGVGGGGCSVAVTPGYNALLAGSRETGLNHERGKQW